MSALRASLQLLVRVASGYHIPLHQLRMEPHCWPLDADENNDETIDCGGKGSLSSLHAQ